MPQFAPDLVTFNDAPGLGMWDDNHHREHQQFVQVLAGLNPAVLIPTFDLLQMLTAGPLRKQALEVHQEAHALLRNKTNVSGVDYTDMDLNNEQDFYSFLGYHASEHAAIRAALGMT